MAGTNGKMSTMLMLALIGYLAAVSALPDCSPRIVKFHNSSKLVLAVVGDWGRFGAESSYFNPFTVKGCAAEGKCCSSEQNANFPDEFDASEVMDAPQQVAAANLLNTVCGKVGCNAVLGVGDNFYPCGADDPASGLNRFNLDWKHIYGSQKNLKGLKWYHVTGNHDYGFELSVARQVNYTQQDDTWVLPERYYATRAHGSSLL